MGVGALAERRRELESLSELLRGAARGEGRVALVEGPAGIGKSRLLAEVRGRAGTDALVLGARCSELERSFAFGVVRQLFEVALVEPGRRERALAGAAAAAEAVFGPAADTSACDQGPDTSFATLHGLYWLTLNLAVDRPLVLAVDDLHWCDRASLRFLAYLCGRLDGQPVLLAVTVRGADPGTDPALIAELAQGEATVTIRPGALSPEACAGLVRERLDADADPAFCDACHEATGGNPLLLVELLGALRADGARADAGRVDLVRAIGSRAVGRTILLRLARLPAPASDVARAVAVLGEGAQLPAVAALSGLDEPSAAEAVSVLARAEILRFDAPLGFVHPLVREAVYHDLPAAERELQHARAARVLDDAGAAVEQVAAQLLEVSPRSEAWAAERLREAGQLAARRGAPDSAVPCLLRAFQEPAAPEVRPGLLFELGVAEALANGHQAVEHLRCAYAELDDPARQGRAAQLLAQTLLFTGDPAEAAVFARHAAGQLPPDLSDQRDALEAMQLMTALFGADDPDALRRLERLRTAPVGAGAGPGARMLAAVSAYDWALSGGSAQESADLALRALDGDTLIAADNGFVTVVAIMVLVLAERDEALTLWDRMLADAHRRGSLWAVASVHLFSGQTMLRRGDLAEAERLVHACGSELRVWGRPSTAGIYFLAATLLERGDLDGARRVLGDRDDTARAGSATAQLWLPTGVQLLLAENRAEEALELAERCATPARRMVNPAWAPWLSLRAQALDRLGRRDEALALAEQELARARRWGAAGTVGRTLRILGTLRREDGMTALEEAVAVREGSPARLERAKALAALGAALRRARRPTDAREPLSRALELAEVCGAAALARDVRTELRATGARPRRHALSGVDSLTASERRVADLAAEGRTNREIAQTLFVTPKTVELHLSSAYRKLDIRSRRELAVALAA